MLADSLVHAVSHQEVEGEVPGKHLVQVFVELVEHCPFTARVVLALHLRGGGFFQFLAENHGL